MLLWGFCEHFKTVMTKLSLYLFNWFFIHFPTKAPIKALKFLLSNFFMLATKVKKLNGCVCKKINSHTLKLFEDAMNNFKQSSIIYRHEEWMPSKIFIFFIILSFSFTLFLSSSDISCTLCHRRMMGLSNNLHSLPLKGTW